MAYSLEGCRGRFQRGRDQLQHLDGDIQRFLDREPYRVFDDFWSEPGYRLRKIRIYEHPPLEWSFQISEIVDNLRASLDYLVCELTLKNGNPVEDSTGFPILDRSDSWRGAEPRYVGGLSEIHRARIEWAQPYSRSQQDPSSDALSILRELSNKGKHQFLHVVGALLKGGVFVPLPRANEVFVGPPIPMDTLGVEFGPFKDGAKIYRARMDSMTDLPPEIAKVEVKEQFAFDVSFSQEGPGAGRPVLDTLRDIVDRVGEVLSDFDSFL
jgi:hypothetical protein